MKSSYLLYWRLIITYMSVAKNVLSKLLSTTLGLGHLCNYVTFIYFMFQNIALHSEMMKKSRVDSWDVNTVLMLSDTSPVVGTSSSHYVAVGDEKLCCQVVRQFC